MRNLIEPGRLVLTVLMLLSAMAVLLFSGPYLEEVLRLLWFNGIDYIQFSSIPWRSDPVLAMFTILFASVILCFISAFLSLVHRWAISHMLVCIVGIMPSVITALYVLDLVLQYDVDYSLYVVLALIAVGFAGFAYFLYDVTGIRDNRRYGLKMIAKGSDRDTVYTPTKEIKKAKIQKGVKAYVCNSVTRELEEKTLEFPEQVDETPLFKLEGITTDVLRKSITRAYSDLFGLCKRMCAWGLFFIGAPMFLFGTVLIVPFILGFSAGYLLRQAVIDSATAVAEYFDRSYGRRKKYQICPVCGEMMSGGVPCYVIDKGNAPVALHPGVCGTSSVRASLSTGDAEDFNCTLKGERWMHDCNHLVLRCPNPSCRINSWDSGNLQDHDYLEFDGAEPVTIAVGGSRYSGNREYIYHLLNEVARDKKGVSSKLYRDHLSTYFDKSHSGQVDPYTIKERAPATIYYREGSRLKCMCLFEMNDRMETKKRTKNRSMLEEHFDEPDGYMFFINPRMLWRVVKDKPANDPVMESIRNNSQLKYQAAQFALDAFIRACERSLSVGAGNKIPLKVAFVITQVDSSTSKLMGDNCDNAGIREFLKKYDPALYATIRNSFAKYRFFAIPEDYGSNIIEPLDYVLGNGKRHTFRRCNPPMVPVYEEGETP